MTETWRDRAEDKRQQRRKARAAGLCGICCTGQPRPGRKTCERCLETSRVRSRQLYEARRQLRAQRA